MGSIGLGYRKVSVGDFRTTPKMLANMDAVLNSGLISYGPYSQRFETEMAEMHGNKYGILSNSGTSSLQVALQAMKEIHGWEYGQVIVPATTFVATPNIVNHNRLVPVFVDVDPHTYNIDPEKVSQAITDDTKAIIPVHLLGQPANMDAINQTLVDKHRTDICVIADSCECMFARHNGYTLGTLADITVFSTYVAHLIVTGVGGMAITDNEAYAAKMRSLVNHGLQIDFLNPDANFAPRPMPGRRFRFDSVGHSYRITEMEAALGCAQLDQDYLDWMLHTRRRNANHLGAGIMRLNRDYGDMFNPYVVQEGNSSAHMMYPIVLNKRDWQNVDKEPWMAFLNARGIETRDLLPLIGQPIYKWLEPARYPVSHWLVESGFYVGCHQYLEPEDIDYVLQSLEEACNEFRH